MNLTLKIKLLHTDEQKQMLLDTMKAFNKAANYVSDVAFKIKTASQVRLHHECYYKIREQFGLSAQMAVRTVGKVVEALRRDRTKHHRFKPYGAIVLDNRLLSYKGIDRVSILTLQGRQVMPFVCGKYGQQRLRRVWGQADLMLQNGQFYLLQNCVLPDPELKKIKGFLGCDLGIVHLAATSDGTVYGGEPIEENRRKMTHHRRNLQRKGTKSAKRKLKKVGNKQARFQGNTNHCISKSIVKTAKRTHCGIALEELKGILSGVTARRRQRARLHNWGFYQLRQFLTYKAKMAGIPLVFVDPRYTSQQCPQCSHISRSNRSTRDLFRCVRCGFSAPADTVASLNIRDRATVNWPMVATA